MAHFCLHGITLSIFQGSFCHLYSLLCLFRVVLTNRWCHAGLVEHVQMSLALRSSWCLHSCCCVYVRCVWIFSIAWLLCHVTCHFYRYSIWLQEDLLYTPECLSQDPNQHYCFLLHCINTATVLCLFFLPSRTFTQLSHFFFFLSTLCLTIHTWVLTCLSETTVLSHGCYCLNEQMIQTYYYTLSTNTTAFVF